RFASPIVPRTIAGSTSASDGYQQVANSEGASNADGQTKTTGKAQAQDRRDEGTLANQTARRHVARGLANPASQAIRRKTRLPPQKRRRQPLFFRLQRHQSQNRRRLRSRHPRRKPRR